MNIRRWSGQNHNTVIIHEYISDFNPYFVQNAFLDTRGGHLYTSHNTQAGKLGKSTEYKCPPVKESARSLGERALSDCQKTPFSSEYVGASIARPPKTKFFGFSKEKLPGFRLAATDFALAKSADDRWSPLLQAFLTRSKRPFPGGTGALSIRYFSSTR